MQFCLPHWDSLKTALKVEGLGDFVEDRAVKIIETELESLMDQSKKTTKQNFNALMAAHWMIIGRTMDTLRGIGYNPLMIMLDDPDHPEWKCPLCCLNWLSLEHDRTCKDPNCKKPKGLNFDDWPSSVATYLKTELIPKLPEG